MNRLSFAFLLLSVVTLAACEGGPQSAFNTEAVAAGSAVRSGADMAVDRSELGDRKIAEKHTLHIETDHKTLSERYYRDLDACRELDCEIVHSSVSDSRSGSLHVRLDPEHLSPFLDTLTSGPGKVKRHQVSADDKTFATIDAESRLDNAKALRTRYQKLLERADEVGDILAIERELNRVEGEIESATARLRHLQTITQKATVQVRYSVPYQLSHTTLREAAKVGYVKGQAALADSAENAIEFGMGALPWLPILALLPFGVWIIWRLFRGVLGLLLRPFRRQS